MLKLVISIAASLIMLLPCYGEVLRPIEFEGQPTVLMEDGNVSLCGIRFFGIEANENISNPTSKIWVSDASVNIAKSGFGMAKAIALTTNLEAFQKSEKPTSKAIKNFWIKTQGTEATMPIDGVARNGDVKNSKIYVTSITPALRIITAIVEGKAIQIGYKFDDSFMDFAFYGKVKLAKEDVEQLSGCIEELLGNMQKNLGQEK